MLQCRVETFVRRNINDIIRFNISYQLTVLGLEVLKIRTLNFDSKAYLTTCWALFVEREFELTCDGRIRILTK
jgi:hypothetical protein